MKKKHRRHHISWRDKLPTIMLIVAAIAAGVYALYLVTDGTALALDELDKPYVQLNADDSLLITSMRRNVDTLRRVDSKEFLHSRVAAPLIADSDSVNVQRSLYRSQKEDVHIDLSEPENYTGLREWWRIISYHIRQYYKHYFPAKDKK